MAATIFILFDRKPIKFENTLYYNSKQFTHNTHCKSEITTVLRVYVFLLVHRKYLDALDTLKHQNKP